MTCSPRTCPFAARIKQLERHVLLGEPVPDPSMERAVEASMRGDWGPLMRINEERKRRGGDARHAVTDIPETTHTGTTAL